MEITSRSAHVRFKTSGNPQKFALFCYIAGILDLDFPLAPKAMRRDPEADLHCHTCGGLIYKIPNLTVNDLKDLARQVNETKKLPGNFKLKIKQFTYNPDCKQAPELSEES